MDLLFDIVRTAFQKYPLRASVTALVIVLFFVLTVVGEIKARVLSKWGILIPAVAWGAYVVYEAVFVGPHDNIRLDLCVIFPALIFVSLWGGVPWVLARGNGHDENRDGIEHA